MNQSTTASASTDPIAVVCGAGALPFAVAEALTKRRRRVVLFAIRGLADSERVRAYRHHWAALGQFGRFCRLARAEGCREVVWIGSVTRPPLWRIRPDLRTLRLLPRVWRQYRGGDDHLLSGIATIFEEHGFRVVGVPEIAPELLMPEGPLGRHWPGERDTADIEKGLSLLDALSPFDIGQAAVVADRRVLAVEAAEGTDLMLSRIARLREAGHIEPRFGHGVLVKAAKHGQDRRLDLPSIGPQTVAGAAKARLAGLAVTAGSAIVAEPQRLREAADAAGLFVVGVRERTGNK
jgi:DUF1009 family protein